MGRGSSKIGAGGNSGGRMSNAVAIENMTEAQIDSEIKKAERAYQAAQKTIDRYTKESAEDAAMRGAFPLGSGGLSRRDAEKVAGEKSERAAARAKIVSDAIDKRDTAKKRIDNLEKAKKEIHGTGMTLKEKTDSEIKKAAQSDRKWRTTQKGGMVNGGYKPKIIQSGNYEIHGSNGFFRVYESGKQIAATGSLTTAKAAVEMHEKRKKR